jgi:hypothetical protein
LSLDGKCKTKAVEADIVILVTAEIIGNTKSWVLHDGWKRKDHIRNGELMECYWITGHVIKFERSHVLYTLNKVNDTPILSGVYLCCNFDGTIWHISKIFHDQIWLYKFHRLDLGNRLWHSSFMAFRLLHYQFHNLYIRGTNSIWC